jgi:hypothetical protein
MTDFLYGDVTRSTVWRRFWLTAVPTRFDKGSQSAFDRQGGAKCPRSSSRPAARFDLTSIE